MSINLHIRPFTPDDYPALVDIHNTIWPEHPSTVEQTRYRDEHRDPMCKFQRLVGVRGGKVVASAMYDQSPHMYHPHKFIATGLVHPDHQRQGIGSALLDHLLANLQRFDPLLVRAATREDLRHSIQFLLHRGFQEETRTWESRLDVTAFDPTPYAGLEENLRAQGVMIMSLKELETDPDRDRKLYMLEHQIDQDVPHPDEQTQVSYEHFVENRLNHPGLIPAGYFVAVHDGAYVGMGNLWRLQGTEDLENELTGVVRAYRRRGIALALKLRTIAYAKAHECPTIRTWNASNNAAILAINDRMGFVRQPAAISFVKHFKADQEPRG